MNRLVSIASLVSLASMVAGCFESHQNQQALRGDDCYVCHTPEYDATSQPPHGDARFQTTCVDCHRTTSWQPALGGLHPAPRGDKATFLLDGSPHADIACMDCHDLDLPSLSYPLPDPVPPEQRGLNADCIQCHPNDAYHADAHQGVVSATGGAYQTYRADVPNFCRTCHPEGTARKHPNDRFRVKGNEHHDRPCTSCHIRANGPDDFGQNTSCTGCHDDGGAHVLTGEDGMNAKHVEFSNYPGCRDRPPIETNPPRTLTAENFCLHCHPNGGGGRNASCE